MINSINLAPFNNFLPFCPFCGERPIGNPCVHLKAFIFIEKPEEGSSKIIYLSEDFRDHLKNVMGTEFEFKVDKMGPPPKRLDGEYYFKTVGDIEDSNHIAELANAIGGAVCFQQAQGENIIRSITFAMSAEEHSNYEIYDTEMAAYKRETVDRMESTFAKSIVYDDYNKPFLQLEEDESLEFKQTFSVDTHTKKISKEIRKALIREIVGFLNTRYGQIIIGVHDKTKEIIGIEHDGFEGNKDKYTQQIMNMIKDLCGETAASLVELTYEKYAKSTVCVVTCKKSDHPVYCKFSGNGEIPFVRYGSSTSTPSYKEWEQFQKQHFRTKQD